MRRWTTIGVFVWLAAAGTSFGVHPGEWVHKAEADFQNAALDHTVVTNLGRIELSRASQVLVELDATQALVNDIIRTADGRALLATGPTGEVVELTDEGELEEVASFDGAQVFTLAADGEAFWVGISGDEARLERHANGQVTRTIALPDTKYVWDIVPDGPRLWIGTGSAGRVLVVDLEAGAATPVAALETGQPNVLCLSLDGRGRVYAGTDGEGLVYRLTRQGAIVGVAPAVDEPNDVADGNDANDATADANDVAVNDTPRPLVAAEGVFTTYVVYDAAEPEIGAMIVNEDGSLYIGTADAEQARPGRLADAAEEEKGSPTPSAGAAPGAGDDADDGDGDDGDDGDGDQPEPPQPQPDPEPLPGAGDADAQADGGDAAAVGAAPAKPTTRQYDKVRQVIRTRLAKLREGQRVPMQVQRGGRAGSSLSTRRPSGSGTAGTASAQKKEGNAVYFIDADGFVREVFRESVMILRLLKQGDHLIIATGNEGQIYRVDTTGENTTVLADLESQQVPAMVQVDDRIVIGTANPGQVVELTAGYADEGTFTSDPLDAAQISLWGQLSVLARVPDNAAVAVQTRTGNVGDADSGYWTEWTAPRHIDPEQEGDVVHVEVASPPARFIQYRLRLTSNGDATPAVSRVGLKYLMPNLRPGIASLTATYPDPTHGDDGAPQPRTTINVEWEASDDNGDALTYQLEVRQLGEEQPFVKLAEDLEETTYEWDTRSMPDGRYELRLTASDERDNVPDQARTARRVSGQVTVDNTPPDITDLAIEAAAAGEPVSVTARVTDATSPITQIRYSVDGEDDWRAILPADMIYDSTNERVTIKISDLSPGPHVVSLRATDALGNSRYVWRAVTVPDDQ